jgi:hypothetical protein
VTRPIFAEVNRHVTYYGTNRKPRPATMTTLNGAGSTTLSSAASALATTIATVATAAVGQWVTILDTDPTKWEQRRVSAVSGTGPFTLTIPAIRYGHNSGTAVKLEPTSVNLRIRRAQTINTVPRQVNANETNVWSPK